jgi:hypothetical protein
MTDQPSAPAETPEERAQRLNREKQGRWRARQRALRHGKAIPPEADLRLSGGMFATPYGLTLAEAIETQIAAKVASGELDVTARENEKVIRTGLAAQRVREMRERRAEADAPSVEALRAWVILGVVDPDAAWAANAYGLAARVAERLGISGKAGEAPSPSAGEDDDSVADVDEAATQIIREASVRGQPPRRKRSTAGRRPSSAGRRASDTAEAPASE